MTKKTLAYVLLSGGVDSATALTRAVKEVGQSNVHCISVDYGQRHVREIAYAAKLSNFYGRPWHALNLQSIIPHTLLKDPETEMPDVTYADIKGVSPSYVPFRNGLMLSALTSHVHGELIRMQKDLDKSSEHPSYVPQLDALIYAGMHAEDAAGGAYPDCTLEFIGAMANAINVGCYGQVRLVVPFIHSTKEEIVQYGFKNGTPYHLTWSCYAGKQVHCGACSTCYARAAAFVNAGVEDPTEYHNDPTPTLLAKGLISQDHNTTSV